MKTINKQIIKDFVKVLFILASLNTLQVQAVSSNNFLPLVKECKHTNILKIRIANVLSKWTIETLEKSGTIAAVISRPGTRFVRMIDKTGMGHTGIIIKDPELNTWMIYNLFSNPLKKHKFYEIRRTTVYDFFYSQPSLKLNALVLIPSLSIQESIINSFITGKNKELLKEKKYNLISSSENFDSSNCIEWVVLNIFAAKENMYDVDKLTEIIKKEIFVKSIKLTSLSKLILAFTPNVFKDELPKDSYVKTFIANDLYNSSVFIKKIFYVGTNKS